MSACDVEVKTDFTIRRTNPLEEIALKVDDLVAGVLRDEEERIAKLREAIQALIALKRKPIEPFHVYLDLPDRILWNWALGRLDHALAELEGNIQQVEEAARQFGEAVGRVLAGVGNPGTLVDVARLLREGVSAMATDLSPQVSLSKLSVDNEWDSAAAERYAERAQVQCTLGLDELAAKANALADALDGHSDSEVSFWEGVADLVIEIVVFLVGLFFTILGAVDMFGGAVAAAPTAGAGLLVSALGLISFIGGLLVTAVSGFMIVQSMGDLITTAEASLSATVATIEADAMLQGTSWPILAQ